MEYAVCVIYQRRWRERVHALIFDESSPSDFSKQISRMILSLRIKFYNSLPDTIYLLFFFDFESELG